MDRVVAPGATPTQSFEAAAPKSLADPRLRHNLDRAVRVIRDKRADAVGELPDWDMLRAAGSAIKDTALFRLDDQLKLLEEAVEAAGGVVHWARDGADATRQVLEIAQAHQVEQVVKVKSIATDEIGLNEALEAGGVDVVETDLAELIVQLAGDRQSHILVPAIHKGRSEIAELFRDRLGLKDLGDAPEQLAEAARLHLRERFLEARMGISGANFAVAETGAVCIFESEGNGRMCTTLPEVLVTVMGIEKVVPQWRDMEVFLQLLPRSSTGERMNPYTSVWTGVREGDGPREFHLILLDNGRSAALADEVGRQALRCIRCSACLNVCPVYSRVGGHAYGSVYPGPIGAILTPQLVDSPEAASLPFASTLCGACGDVCPVEIEIPKLLVHLRGRARHPRRERLSMAALFRAFGSRRRYERAQRVARIAQRPLMKERGIRHAPGPLAAWTSARDLPPVAEQTFREWWLSRSAGDGDALSAARVELPGRAAEAGTSRGRFRKGDGTSENRARTGDGTLRSEVLGRIADSLAGAPAPPEISRRYRSMWDPEGPTDRVALFAERVREYGATVVRVSRAQTAETLERLCEEAAAARLVIPADLPAQWKPQGLELVVDEDLSARELDCVDGVITAAALGIAETGTLVLDTGLGQGRRALSLVPDLHLCVVLEQQIVGVVPEAVASLTAAVADQQPITFISGPSATSDIELSRVEGVHGPRALSVLIVG
jgi:L-lactate dehydrogenase complex protein LldF